MSPRVKNNLNIFLGLILIGLGSWAAIWMFQQFASWYEHSSDAIKTGVLAAVPVVTVAILGYFANKAIETKRSVEQLLRPKKLELYEEFIDFLMTIFGNEKVRKRPSEAETVRFFSDKTPKLMTFASNGVIEKWGKLRIGLNKGSDEEKMFLIEDTIREIRNDLGHEKKGFHKGDILRLFINDIDDHLKTRT